MSEWDLGIEWEPEPNEGDRPPEPDALPFFFNVETTRWTLLNGYLDLERNDDGWLFSGCIDGKDIHDEDHEDFYFSSADELLAFFEKHGLLRLLSRSAT